MYVIAGSPWNEYAKRGELYQCFVDGDAVYKGNILPQHRGGNWVEFPNGAIMEVVDCFCMGCMGI